MKTNRELYKRIECLLKEKEGHTVPQLETYLSNLIGRAGLLADKDVLSLEDFFAVLRDAFDGGDGAGGAAGDGATPGFRKWKDQVIKQIGDLQEMARNGQLKNQYRYLGVSAPSGGRWYNFDPCTYVECGIAGALGGWEDGDDTGRSYVPGLVACIGPDGKITSRDPRELSQSPVEVPGITWEMFSDFVWCGQNYE